MAPFSLRIEPGFARHVDSHSLVVPVSRCHALAALKRAFKYIYFVFNSVVRGHN